jgi:hypothetical protein
MLHRRWWGRRQRHAGCGKSGKGISDSWATYNTCRASTHVVINSSYTDLQHPSTSAVRCQQVQGSDSAVPCIINAGVGTLCIASIEPLSSLFRHDGCGQLLTDNIFAAWNACRVRGGKQASIFRTAKSVARAKNTVEYSGSVSWLLSHCQPETLSRPM